MLFSCNFAPDLTLVIHYDIKYNKNKNFLNFWLVTDVPVIFRAIDEVHITVLKKNYLLRVWSMLCTMIM